MIAIDKSPSIADVIYAVYCNRPGIYSFASKPYLTWSYDQGLTWSPPSTSDGSIVSDGDPGQHRC